MARQRQCVSSALPSSLEMRYRHNSFRRKGRWMRQNRRIRAAFAVVGLTVAVATLPADTAHRNPLGTGEQLVFGGASVKFEVKEHGPSREYAHKGDASETIRIR